MHIRTGIIWSSTGASNKYCRCLSITTSPSASIVIWSGSKLATSISIAFIHDEQQQPMSDKRSLSWLCLAGSHVIPECLHICQQDEDEWCARARASLLFMFYSIDRAHFPHPSVPLWLVAIAAASLRLFGHDWNIEEEKTSENCLFESLDILIIYNLFSNMMIFETETYQSNSK